MSHLQVINIRRRLLIFSTKMFNKENHDIFQEQSMNKAEKPQNKSDVEKEQIIYFSF